MQGKELSNLIILNFSDSKLPAFKSVNNKPYVLFGEKDDYPTYLLELYNKSAKHNAIIGGKVTYIFGEGFTVDNENDKDAQLFKKQINSAGESLNDIAKRSISDIEIFGGFAWQIIFDLSGDVADIFHLDFHKVRSNKENTEFYYKRDWQDRKEEIKHYPAFNPKIGVTSIFYFKEYRPGIGVYPLPCYVGSNNYIESDVEISKHTLTNAKTGFSASKFINFYNGEPNEDQKRQIEKRFNDKFTGAEGKKILIGFNNDPAKKPTIDDLGTSDVTKEDFSHIDDLITGNIFAGHQVTSPTLFGIQEPGKLGTHNELRLAFEIFKNTYASTKQQQFEQVVNYFARIKGITSNFSLIAIDPVGIEFGDQVLLQAAPRSWLLEKLGVDIKKYTDDPVGAKNEAVNTLPPVKPPVLLPEETMKKKHKEEEVAEMFAEVGQGREDYLIVKSRVTNFTSDKEVLEDELSIYQSQAAKFAEAATALEANILSLIQKDKRVSAETIAQTLDVDISTVNDAIETLETKGLLRVKHVVENGEKIAVRTLTKPLSSLTPTIKSELPEIFIKYSYEVKPGAGPAIIPGTRPFCKRMVELDKLYSRSEIEQISQRLGYSVWDRRGGFWNHNGETDAACRHIWKSNIVIKRRK